MLKRIERDILMLTLVAYLITFSLTGIHEAVSLLIGGLIALINFRFIHRGVIRLLDTATVQARKRYLVGSFIRFGVIAIVLGAVFASLNPSVLLFLVGFSLFIPSVLLETMVMHFITER